jgi:RHS repeat-associated protein
MKACLFWKFKQSEAVILDICGLLISMRIDGGTLISPTLVYLPNRAEYGAGTKVDLWGLNPLTGKFEVIGQGVVSADGKTVQTTSGGIQRSGTYFFAPVPTKTLADVDNPLIGSESNLYQGAIETINSEANLDDGSVTDTQNLISYQSLGINHQFQLRYNSKWADPTQLFQATYDDFKPGQGYQWLTQRLVIRRGKFVQEVAGANRNLPGAGRALFAPNLSIGLVGGEHFYSIGKNTGKISSGYLPVDFSQQGSGVYQIKQSVGLKKLGTYFDSRRYFGSATTVGVDRVVVNRSASQYGNADFGRGWSLVGLQELLLTRANKADNTPLYRDKTTQPKVNDNVPIALVDGNGQTIVYRPGVKVNGVLQFTGPVGDYSKLEKLANGNYRRTMLDQTVYVFDRWGQLITTTDRNDNETAYSYDTHGHLVEIKDPVGLQTKFNVVGDRIESIVTPDGRTVKFNYAGADLEKIVDAEAGERSWTYSANGKGWVSTFKDERGNTGKDNYDQWGRIVSAKLRDGTTKTFTTSEAYIPVYETSVTALPSSAPSVVVVPTERISVTVDGKGQSITRKYNKEGRTSEIIDDLGVREITKIGADSRPQSVTDQYGFVTSYGYDEKGNTTSIVDGDYEFPTGKPTRIFGDEARNYHLIEDAERLVQRRGGKGSTGLGTATQSSLTVGDDKNLYYVIGTNLSYLIVASGLTTAEQKLAPPSEQGRLVVRSVVDLGTLVDFPSLGSVSLQQIRVLSNEGIAIGYDRHPYDENNGSTSISSANDLGFVTSTTATVIPDTALKTNQFQNYYLSDTRRSDIDFNAKGGIIYAYVGTSGNLSLRSPRDGNTVGRGSFANQNPFSPQKFNFAVGDLAIGDFNGDKIPDAAAINALDEVSRPQFQVLESTLRSYLEAPPGLRRSGDSWNPPNSSYSDVLLSNGKRDYFAAGRKLAAVNIGDSGGDDLVVATIGTAGGGQSWLSFYTSNANREFDLVGQVSVPYYVNALQSYETVADPKLANSLVQPAGHGVFYVADHLYLIPDATKPTEIYDYGRVGNVQGMVSADFDEDGINDIAIADSNQNLKVFLLDAQHKIKEQQVTHINVKPRQLTYALGQLLITDGGSGLDILGNQYLAYKANTPAAQGFVSKTFTYDSKFNQLLEFADELGRKEVHELDARGNVTKIIRDSNGLKSTTEYSYNFRGQVVEETDPDRNITKREYDKYGRLIKVSSGIKLIAPLREESFEYADKSGNITKKIDGRGTATTYNYDKMNRLIGTSITVSGQVVESKTDYYKDGLVLAVTDANKHTTSYTYDGVGRKLTETAADGGVMTYGYDAAGDLSSMVDQVGRNTTYKFDARQRLIEENQTTIGLKKSIDYNLTTPINTVTESAVGEIDRVSIVEYDRYQQVIKTTNAEKTVTENVYNKDHTLKSTVVTPNFAPGNVGRREMTYDYDSLKRQVRMVDAAGFSTKTAYDLVGNVLSIEDGNAHTTTYSYDALNRKIDSTMGYGTAEAVTSRYVYDANNNLVEMVDPLLRVSKYSYDELNRQISATMAFGTDRASTTRHIYDGVGNCLVITDAVGNTTSFEYDELNRQVKTIDALKRTIDTKKYDQAGRMSEGQNAYGEKTSYTYDNAARSVIIANKLGSSTRISDAYGNMKNVVDAVGNTSSYTYDVMNRRETMTDAAGGVMTYRYDEFNNVRQEIDQLGRVTNNTYDNLNRLVRVDRPLGVTEIMAYDALNKLSMTDGEGRTTRYGYDALNRNILIIDPLGHKTQNIYDASGNIDRMIDAKGRITEYEYDELNRKIAVTRAFGTADATTMSYIYDAASNLRYETNGRGFTTEYKYDELNWRSQVIDPLNNVTKTEYDLAGKITKSIDAYGHTNISDYDTFGRLTKSTDEIGDVVAEYGYDALDRVIQQTDTFGKITTIKYEDNLRTKTTINPQAVTTIQIKDAVGNTTDMYQANRHTHYDFDALNRKEQVIDAEGGVTKYAYFKDNQTRSMTDSAGNTTSYAYDGEGRLMSETTVFGTRSYGYDEVDNRVDMIDRNGRAIHYSIDNLNRVTAEEWINSPNSQKFTYSYDKNSNVISADDGKIKYEYGYEARDLVEKVDRLSAGQSTVSFAHRYDNVGNLTETKEIVGGVLTATNSYKYDDLRYYNTQVLQSGIGLADKRVDFVYAIDSGLMREVDRYLGNQLVVKTINSYDDFGRLTGIVHQNSTGVISTHGYDYDSLNRLTAESRDGVSRSFAYDKIDEVKSVSGSNTESYTYDKNGNRTNTGYQHTNQNRLTTDGVYSYDYDNEGNRTKRTEIATGKVDEYTWDYRNRLSGVASKDIYGVVTQTVSYEYDVNDLRVKKSVDGSIENYYLNGDNIAFVTDGDGKQTFHYLYGMGADQVLAQDSETGMVWSLADRLGSIDVLVNEQGSIVDQRTYDSFGNTLSQLDPNVKFRFGYTGRESDPETGLYYYRARYFDANVGRFISTDPIGFEAGDSNLYRYVFNNSTTYTDPSGEIIPLLLGAAFIGGFFGGAYGVADHIEKGGTLDNINWGDIGGKAAFGAFAGAGITALAVGAAVGAVALGVAASTVTATGLVLGAAATGWGIGSGIYNIANGKPLTGSLDLIGGVLGAKGLHSGYKSYQSQLSSEKLAKFNVQQERIDNIGAKLDSLSEETRATISSITDFQMVSESPTSNIKILYRGVDSTHPGYKNAQQGIAKPRGGHSDPQDHSIIGDTNSVFTSWTSNIAVAREFANRFSSRGIILEKNFDLSKTRYFRSDMNDGVLQESEYLIRGSVFDAKPIIHESK